MNGLRKVVTVKDYELGLLIRDGRFMRVLEPGRHVFWDLNGRLAFPVFDVRGGYFPVEWAQVLEKRHPAVAEKYLRIVHVGEGQVAIVRRDGEPAITVRPSRVHFLCTAVRDFAHTLVDVRTNPRLTHEELTAVEKTVLDDLRSSPPIVVTQVEQHEVGLVFFDGQLVETLKPGRHGFWSVEKSIRILTLDMRPQPLEITAQEILTKDRVSLRVTLTCFLRISDARQVALSTPDHNQFVYKLVQFAIREAVGGRTLDEVLNDRAMVDKEVTDYVRREMGEIGVDITDLGVKDVILPGEMRDLINKVVEAEKVAQANLIRRREETAATRSLLNTARLMDDNPTLMRLKELEALERVTEKIGRIDVQASSGEGLNALLDSLVTLKKRKAEDRA